MKDMGRNRESKRKYTTIGNYIFIYSEMWKYDRKKFVYMLIEILLYAAVNFGTICLPALVVEMLETGPGTGSMMAGIISAFAVVGLLSAVSTYFERRNRMQYLDWRFGQMTRRVGRKAATIDYVQYEDIEMQKLMKKSMDSLSGDFWGLEGILHYTVVVAKNALCLLLYAFALSGVNLWIIGLLFGVSVIQFFVFTIANRYERQNQDKKAGLGVTENYLMKQAYDVSAGKDIRIYQMQDWLGGWYRKINKKYQELIAKERRRYFANDLAGLLLWFGRDAICYGYLIHLLGKGMKVSSFVWYIGIIAGFSGIFSEITSKMTEISRFQKMVDYLREFLDVKNVFCHGKGEAPAENEDTLEVEFDHVSFAYPGSDKKILDDVSFTMKKGEKLALVGVNGAGKSTIVKLICGFYQPTSGHIYVNGTDIEKLDLDSYQKELAVVFQEAFIISYSIGENVSCLPEGEYVREKCIHALKQAGLWEMIDALPQKEQTYLGKDVDADGIWLSGGQMQKLMLARALYRDARLLLLDEPTAALDAIAENEMYEKYNELVGKKTALFISHRLASTRFCENILFLENGKIVEEGNHDKLMDLGGRYARMFEVQRQYYAEGETEHETEECMA